jgi:excisionase family DNA binding protein
MMKLMSIEDLSAYLDIPKNTLYQWRSHGKGPAARRVGKHLRYRESDVEDWLAGLPVEVA